VAALYRTCPKCGAATGGAAACPSCGLIFEKYLKARLAPARATVPVETRSDEDGFLMRAKELALHVPDEVEPLAVHARALLLAAAAIYGARLVMMDVPDWEMGGTFMHLVLLPFHEFGHLFFRPLGEFMMLLGGSLFQVLLPLALGGYFLVKNRDPFAAALMLWWAGGGILDTAPYVYDAWKPQHVLLTGRTGDTGAHDFIDVLGDLGLLHRAQPIGRGVHLFGAAVMALGLAWAAWLLVQQYRARRA
jgi:hypothetical protein